MERLQKQSFLPLPGFRESLDWFLGNKSHIVGNLCVPLDRDGSVITFSPSSMRDS